MADRWRVLVEADEVQVERNGRWYTGVEDVDDAEALLRNQRVRSYTLVNRDGYQEQRSL